jgi:GH25 family lysozyme M1 (1,4-beta-N-acetylmuramidase)
MQVASARGVAVAIALVTASPAAAGEFASPWKDAKSAIVLDPFAGNALNWDQVATDKKVVAVIHKASQGVGRDTAYAARKSEATGRGYLWGSYHLLTTADVGSQIDAYLAAVGVHGDETYAVDVECLASSGSCQSAAFKVTAEQVEAALRLVKQKTGRLPLVYANQSVAKALSARWSHSAEFAAARLWYARFKSTVTDFPSGPWKTYALWQFSSEINCTSAACPYRVPGTQPDLDVNVFYGTPEDLRSAWPLNR